MMQTNDQNKMTTNNDLTFKWRTAANEHHYRQEYITQQNQVEQTENEMKNKKSIE